jgi:hypothetical protein
MDRRRFLQVVGWFVAGLSSARCARRAGSSMPKRGEPDGDTMDDALCEHLKSTHGLIVGPCLAERIRVEARSATSLSAARSFDIRGRDAASGLPRRATVTAAEIRGAEMRAT